MITAVTETKTERNRQLQSLIQCRIVSPLTLGIVLGCPTAEIDILLRGETVDDDKLAGRVDELLLTYRWAIRQVNANRLKAIVISPFP